MHVSPHAFPVVQTLQQPPVEEVGDRLEQDVVAEVKSNGSSKTGSSSKALDAFACCFLIIMFYLAFHTSADQ